MIDKYTIPIIIAPGICMVCIEISFDHSCMVMENLFVLGQIVSFSEVGCRHV